MSDIELLMDEREITQLIFDYAGYLDTHNWDSFRALFTDEVEMESNLRATPPATLSVDALVTRLSSQVSQFVLTLHYVTNQQVKVSGETATCNSYLYAQHVTAAADDAERFVTHARYVHSLRRTSAGWRISGIAVTIDIRDGEAPDPAAASPR
jgi:3-phenylpropionate/cinnamic acid dioxygenase small subunit